jgi:hypothetical protein
VAPYRLIAFAEDSESADLTADLVDVGEGSNENDYKGGREVQATAMAARSHGRSSGNSSVAVFQRASWLMSKYA